MKQWCGNCDKVGVCGKRGPLVETCHDWADSTPTSDVQASADALADAVREFVCQPDFDGGCGNHRAWLASEQPYPDPCNSCEMRPMVDTLAAYRQARQQTPSEKE